VTDGRIEPRWLTVSQIVRIHDEQLQMFGGPGGLRDAGLLASAIDRPRNKWVYG
jgi:death on curing protein